MIDYEHGSPAVGVLAGFIGGANQQRKYQEQLALQQAQLDQQGQIADARLNEDARQSDLARQLQERLALLSDRRGQQQIGLSLARDKADNFYNLQKDAIDFQQQMAANAAQQQAIADRAGYQSLLDQAEAQSGAQIDWMMDAGKQANEGAKQALSSVRQMNLSPEGERMRAEWDARIRSFQAKQGELRPEAYSYGLNKMLEGMAQAGIEDFEIKDMTPEEIMARQVIWQDDNNMLIQQPDGKLTLQGKVMPKPEAAPKAEKPVDPDKVPIDTPFGEKMTPADSRRRMAEYRRDAIAEIKTEHELAIASGTAQQGTKPTITDADILERVRKRIENENKWWDEQMGGKDEEAQATSADPYAAPTLDQILGGQAANTPLQAPWAPGPQQQPVDQTLPPPPFVGVPQTPADNISDIFTEPSADAMPAAPEQAAGPTQVRHEPYSQAPPRYALPTFSPEAAAKNQDVKGWFKYLDGVYFKASSPQDVTSLPPGTKVVLPDGRVGTVK